jgi:hypothetical protein
MGIQPTGGAGGAGAAQPAKQLPQPENAGQIIKNRLKSLLEKEYKLGNRGKLNISYTIDTDGKLNVKNVDTKGWKGYNEKEIADKVKGRLNGLRFQKPAKEKDGTATILS